MGAHAVVLCIQDTTELDFNGQEIAGLGPLSYEAQRGMYLHPTYAVTPEREPLGMLDAWMWAREKRGKDGVRPGLKESRRWVEGYERIAEQAAQLPGTRLVYMADREADMVEMMRVARDLGTPADWLVAEGLVGRELVLHSDNGSSMKGSTMLGTLEKLGIMPSFSRPRVSNDNAYAESLFRTCKYRPNYPSKPFESIEQARQWTMSFVQWYNHQHKHSGLKFVTPAQRHDGRAASILSHR